MESQIIIGTLTISILHGLVPSHWLPILAFEKKYGWSKQQTYRITVISALAHALSTVLLGLLIGFFSLKLNEFFGELSEIIFSSILILMGLIFIIRHHRHNHFHLHNENELQQLNSKKVITLLVVGMFLSPCLEIEGYYILAGTLGFKYVFLISFIYIFISLAGIILWMAFARQILKRINTHKIEHNAGLFSGIILVISGILNYFLH